MDNESKSVKPTTLQKVKNEENKKLLTVEETSKYLLIFKGRHYKSTNRKIPCSKYSGRYIIFFEDAFCLSENSPIDEDDEPP